MIAPIDGLVLLFLLLCVWKLGVSPQPNRDYLSLEACKAYRGLFAAAVIFHHISLRTDSGLFFPVFTQAGYLSVAVFFFYSGFGLMKKHMSDPYYRQRFLARRVVPLLGSYLVISFLYWLLNGLNGTWLSPAEVLTLTFLQGFPIAANSWYILAILLFYLVFYLLMLLFDRKYLWIAAASVLLYPAYMMLCTALDYSSFWYASSLSFSIGIVWAFREKEIFAFLQKHSCPVIAAALAALICLLAIRDPASQALGVSWTGFNIPISALFAVCVVLLSLHLQLGNPMLRLLGTLSMELYLLHGIFISGLRSGLVYLHSDALWGLAVFLGTLAAAAVYHRIYHFFLGMYLRRLNSH